jgi:hypothetical protein
MLRGHKGPRRSARPMISPLGFRRIRGDRRIYALGRFRIGGDAYFVWALPPIVGELPKGTYRFIATRQTGPSLFTTGSSTTYRVKCCQISLSLCPLPSL